MIDIQLKSTPLSIPDCEAFVETDAAGGAVVFIGTVRNKTQSKAVIRLEFEAYGPMAIREMRKIAERALTEFAVLKIAIHHRTGVFRHRRSACDYCGQRSTSRRSLCRLPILY